MEQKIYEDLSKTLPKEAIQKSEGSKTGKGYDTTGYGYQFIVNRLNEVLGIEGWNYEYKEINRTDGQSKSGSPRIGVCVEMKLTILGSTKSMVGGHISNNYVDALKGAITNSLKKTAAMFGIGKEAYEKTIDEDNLPPDIKKQDETKTKASYGVVVNYIKGAKTKAVLDKIVERLKVNKNFSVEQLVELDLLIYDAKKAIK